ncbi:aspartate 1-decarboxylase [Arcanobacterium hippocoleae]|uniref:Aspartate 1-decarboxylase n=1 Tax=Arcanobacterium hippocoleae TaxID=149017 RepID=A0ABU1T3B6_9ACTO|nr:aspartate 1-decarboxylase [Arcanobacterium hippocoleae]MDR6939876.1 aspartate 1-decarboxylase [Arcanobacterium hippocoleae]
MAERMRQMVTGKIHRATVTGADLHYVGSITIDQLLLTAADILPGERVDVVNVNNGQRLSTYAIPGEPGKGEIILNGAAAHLVHKGDLVIIMCYGMLSEDLAHTYEPKVVFVNDTNQIVDISDQPGIVPETSPDTLESTNSPAGNGLKSSGIPIVRN